MPTWGMIRGEKKALVIGGTKGLGKTIAEQLRHHGIQPIILGRTPVDRSVAEKKGDYPEKTNPLWMRLDLADVANIELVSQALTLVRLGQIQYVFWVAGVGLRGDLESHSADDIARVYQTLVVGPSIFLNKFNRIYPEPYHLITVASTTALRVRNNETIYAAAKGAQARFAVNFHEEMQRTRPGFKSTIVFPGGMNTGFFDGTDVDPRGFMDPRIVAVDILGQVVRQEQDKLYMVMERTEGGGIQTSFPTEPPMKW